MLQRIQSLGQGPGKMFLFVSVFVCLLLPRALLAGWGWYTALKVGEREGLQADSGRSDQCDG